MALGLLWARGEDAAGDAATGDDVGGRTAAFEVVVGAITGEATGVEIAIGVDSAAGDGAATFSFAPLFW